MTGRSPTWKSQATTATPEVIFSFPQFPIILLLDLLMHVRAGLLAHRDVAGAQPRGRGPASRPKD